ncbi:MAG: glycosyltransferase, partial [Muribaculaceae bacterium]|nr:glycosyltransferase [Muribaculaceae bacterium]
MDIAVKQQLDKIKEECERIKPLVVIRCITYNHEAYIRDALEGFVNQKTKFPFVAIVHDDASTDGTANVVREYAEKYPNIIMPIFETENQYSKRDGSLGKIVREAVYTTDAKYIALCEGDDYWIDPLK